MHFEEPSKYRAKLPLYHKEHNLQKQNSNMTKQILKVKRNIQENQIL